MLQAASMFDEKPDALLELRFFYGNLWSFKAC